LRADKREAIVSAARSTFGTTGFARTSIESIAAEAGVSTRTIYKHFRSKDELFASVLQEGASAVADDYVAAVRAGIAAAKTPRERLFVLARAVTKEALGHSEHFAMVRQIAGEAAHLPPDVLKTWRAAGPDRVEQETIAQLCALHDEGLLEIDDLRRAAQHLFALTLWEVSNRRVGRPRLTGKAADAAIAAGVEVFARGYAPR
jgi:AcrR family transcriptional regulator